MELKDNLKKLRTERGLTQAQLAEQLFVSRSTVAKWENGLGLPNPDSMAALEELFGISAQQIATKEPEEVILQKNRKLRLIGQIVGWTLMLAFCAAMCILPVAIQNGSYGFTPAMAAGSYADREYIDTGDYRIYYFTFEGNDLVTGKYWSDLQGWWPVQKHLWGCTVDHDKAQMSVVTKDNYVVGRIYTIKGRHGYYNLLRKAKIYKVDTPGEPMIWNIPEELICATSVTISGVTYELQDGFFFITQEPVRWFEIGDNWYDVIG